MAQLELGHWLKHAVELLGDTAPKHPLPGGKAMWNIGEIFAALRAKGLEVPEHGELNLASGLLEDKVGHTL